MIICIFPSYDYPSHLKSKDLAKEYQKVANEMQTLFLDCSLLAEPGEDSIHLDKTGHKQIAFALSEMIFKTFNRIE